MRKTLSVVAASLAAALALTACSGDTADKATDKPSDAASVTKVVVGASPVPHSQILEFVQENLAKDAGIEIQIREFDDYVLPNQTLSEGELDANYFQHLPYYEAEVKEKGYKFEHGKGVHIEPLHLFSDKVDSPEKIEDGSTIAITNDISNQSRGLELLELAGLLKDVDADTSVLSLTAEQNPKGLKFEEVQPEVVVQLINDPAVAAAVVNSNFILSAGLNTDQSIAHEQVEGNPYANILAWRADNTNEGVKKLDELLHSKEVADFIKKQWPNGNVIPG